MENLRSRVLASAKKDGIGSNAQALDIVLYNNATDKLEIVANGTWSAASYPSSNYIPVGIVVIPGAHGVLKDGDGIINQCGVMSLKYMSYVTPTSGGNEYVSLYYGNYGADLKYSDDLGRYDSGSGNRPLNYNRSTYTASSSATVATGIRGLTVCLPTQATAGSIPARNRSPYAPSPYMTDFMTGEYNESYGTTSFDTNNAHNALADFAGIVNTKVLTDSHFFGQTNWKNSSVTIDNNSGVDYSPAAACCARYKTAGTKAFSECTNEELKEGSGFWYLPAAGELGYIAPRFSDIVATMKNLRTAYGTQYVNISAGGDTVWSSSEYSDDGTHAIYMSFSPYLSMIDYSEKNTTHMARAFMRL